jgi:hypothetical protein
VHARWSALRAPNASARELDEKLWELSGSYAPPVVEGSAWRMSLALARKERGLQRLDAASAELALSPRERWMTFARVEALKWHRLGRVPRAPSRYVARVSVGALRAFELRENLPVGVGLAYTRDWSPTSLERPFRGDPHALMAFVRVAMP